MSKYIDAIKKLESERGKKQAASTLASMPQTDKENHPALPQDAPLPKKQVEVSPRLRGDTSLTNKDVNLKIAKVNKVHLLISLCLLIFLLLLSGAHYKLFSTQKNNSQKIESVYMDLERAKKTILDSKDGVSDIYTHIKTLGIAIDKFATSTSALNAKLEKLENSKDASDTAVENLIKAKNTLFNKLSAIEAELDILKEKTSSKNQGK